MKAKIINIKGTGYCQRHAKIKAKTPKLEIMYHLIIAQYFNSFFVLNMDDHLGATIHRKGPEC